MFNLFLPRLNWRIRPLLFLSTVLLLTAFYNRSYHRERPCHWAYSWPSWLPPRQYLLPAPLNLQTPNYDFKSCLFLQHEFGDTTNGCISTGMSFHLNYVWRYHIFIILTLFYEAFFYAINTLKFPLLCNCLNK
jgi:hypothetical protein